MLYIQADTLHIFEELSQAQRKGITIDLFPLFQITIYVTRISAGWLTSLISEPLYHTKSFYKFPPLPPKSLLVVFVMFLVVFVMRACRCRFIHYYHADVILYPVLDQFVPVS